jgi:hypothetical protein
VFCPDCGHNNPAGNRFCGMCGQPLPQRPAAPDRMVPPAEGPGPVPAEVFPVESAEAVPSPLSPTGVASSEYAPPRAAATSLSGPSFLGLSSPGATDEGGYSYLLDDQESPSRVGRWVAVLLLIALAVAIYQEWQPLKTWVHTIAAVHTAPPPPKPVASFNDATITTGNPPAANSLPPVEQTVNPPAPNALPQQDKDSTDAATKVPAENSRDEESAARKPEAPAVKKPVPKPAKDAASPDESQPSAAESKTEPEPRRAAEPRPGNELVVKGERYLYGRGVPRSCNQALSYFRAAAGMDNPRAFSHLGALYATGECVRLDRAQAYSYFSRALAADRSNPYLEQNLTMLWRDMSPDERQRATRAQPF